MRTIQCLSFISCVYQNLLGCDSEGRLQPMAAALPAPRWQRLCVGWAHSDRPLCCPAHTDVQDGRHWEHRVPQLCAHWPPHGALPAGSQGWEYTGSIWVFERTCVCVWSDLRLTFILQLNMVKMVPRKLLTVLWFLSRGQSGQSSRWNPTGA